MPNRFAIQINDTPMTKIRKAAGKTQEAFSDALEISRSVVCRWEDKNDPYEAKLTWKQFRVINDLLKSDDMNNINSYFDQNNVPQNDSEEIPVLPTTATVPKLSEYVSDLDEYRGRLVAAGVTSIHVIYSQRNGYKNTKTEFYNADQEQIVGNIQCMSLKADIHGCLKKLILNHLPKKAKTFKIADSKLHLAIKESAWDSYFMFETADDPEQNFDFSLTYNL